MSKNLAGLIQILGAGAAGYMQGKKLEAKDAEAKADRDAERAYLNEQRTRERSQWAEQDDMKQTVKDSMADQTVVDVPSYDVSSMAGGDPTQQPIVGYQAAGQSFADKGAAQQALIGTNSQAAKYQRTAKALADKGHTDAARQHEAFYKAAVSEGTDQILGAISASAPSVDAVKKAGGMVAGTIGADAADVFNKTGGKWHVTPETMVQHFVTKDAAGREFVNSRVVGKDGKPVVEDVRAAGLMLADFKTRLAQQNAETKTYQDGQQQAETGRHNKAVEGETSTNNRATRAIQAGTLGIQQQRLNMESQQFKKQTPAGQIAEIEQITGPLSPADKKQIGLSMLGVKGKGGDDGSKATNELVDKLTEKFADTNADPGAVIAYRASLHQKITAGKNNAEVENALREDFSGLKPESPSYARAYQTAKEKGRLSDAALASYGYAAPKATPARMAAQGTARIPSPPTQKIWIGNSYQINPAYAEWEQQYGSTVRKQEAGENARLISGYERVRN
jgi:hypothetical protein